MVVFHFHLVTSRVRHVESRYIGKLRFALVARYGRVGEEPTAFEPGVGWEELERIGFRLRLSELERGAVNVVVQPGHWELPRIDHIGLALDRDEFAAVLARARARNLLVRDHEGRRTFVATGAGYRLELHPPREWLDELLAARDELWLAELHLRADDPLAKATALADLLELELEGETVRIGETIVRFLPGGPRGRPELHAERFGAAATGRSHP